MRLTGVPASPGSAGGPAFVLEEEFDLRTALPGSPSGKVKVDACHPIGNADTASGLGAPVSRRAESIRIPVELQRFQAALEGARDELKAAVESADPEAAAILSVHLLMLEDPMLVDAVRERISSRMTFAEEALSQVIGELTRSLHDTEDEYISKRALDVDDVGRRLCRRLSGTVETVLAARGAVIIARELAPSEVLRCSQAGVVALALEGGAANSHAAILARSLRIPMVVGVNGLLSSITRGENVRVDGSAGVVVIAPTEMDGEGLAGGLDTEEDGAAPRRLSDEASNATPVRFQARPIALSFPEMRTADGRRIRLYANVGRPEELDAALAEGAEGIGVLRTEFLFLETPCSEDEQYQVYRGMAEQLKDRPLIIRTLDIGGDKPLPYLDLNAEQNPFLGVRGLRLSLAMPDFFRTQLRAILRATASGRIHLMYPMVTNTSELVQAGTILAEARAELAKRDITIGNRFEVGAMVEVPAAAICADLLAREATFLSVGTNDLAQYTLAADRNNPAMASIYDQRHPSVLRLLRMTVDGARRWNRPVAVCGEVAADLEALPLLVGLGIDELSVAPDRLDLVRTALQQISYADAVALAASI